MTSLWTFIGNARNRQIISWLGGGIVALAAGAWAVTTYIWPTHEAPAVVCAQGGSIAAGRDASGNTINYNGPAPSGAVAGAAPCADAAKQ